MAPSHSQFRPEPQGREEGADHRAAARRLRKREQDRKAQRISRERKSNRIAHLEALVDQLSQDHADSEIPALMDRLSTVTKEKHALVEILRSLEGTIHRHIEDAADKIALPAPSESRSDDDSDRTGSIKATASIQLRPEPDHTGADPTTGLPWVLGEDHPSLGSTSIPGGSPWDVYAAPSFQLPLDSIAFVPDEANTSPQPLPEPAPAIPSPLSNSSDSVIVPLPTNDCPCISGPRQILGQVLGFNTWRAANVVLAKPSTLFRPEIAATEDATSHDTPIRAILEGWDSVEAAGLMTDSWRKLRQVDDICFSTCGDIERLGILRMMHLMMSYHGDPTPERLSSLPRWFWMRPSQALAHSHAIDYFVWPGVRERFVFSQHRYCTNLFWQLFRGNFHLTWQYGFRECYMQDRHSGKFSISPLFEQRIGDIRCWTMSAGFFAQFPELSQDIPRCDSLPIPVGSAREDAARARDEAQHHAVARVSRPYAGGLMAGHVTEAQTEEALAFNIPASFYFEAR